MTTSNTPKKPTKRKTHQVPLIAVRRGDRFRSRPLRGHARYIVLAGVSAGHTAQGDMPYVTWFETTRTGKRLHPATRLVDGKRVRRAPDGATFLTFDRRRHQWVMPPGYLEVARG